MNGHTPPTSALYRSIHRQPEIIQGVLDRLGPEAGRAAALLAGARRVFVSGTGSSSHAAVVGEHLLRAAGAEAYATTHFDFATYPRPLGSDDVVIALSHTGTTRYGQAVIAQARAAGARVIGITREQARMEEPEVVLRVSPKEESDTYTTSYTASLAALALIAVRLGDATGQDVQDLRDALWSMPRSVAALLAREEELWPVAETMAARGRLVLMGAGPNAVTAREGALKVKESSYLVAEGFELETALHGGLQAVEADDIAVVILAQGPATARSLDLVRALDIIGVRLLLVADERVLPHLPAPESLARPATVVPFAAVPEALSALPATIPLQVLAAFTAALHGTNPDNFRYDEPAYRRAIESLTL